MQPDSIPLELDLNFTSVHMISLKDALPLSVVFLKWSPGNCTVWKPSFTISTAVHVKGMEQN